MMVRTRSIVTKYQHVDGSSRCKKKKSNNSETLHEKGVLEEEISDDDVDVKHRATVKTVRKGSTITRRVVTVNHSSSDEEVFTNNDGIDDTKCFVMGDKRAADYFASRNFRKRSKDDKKIASINMLDGQEIADALALWDASHEETMVINLLAHYKTIHFESWYNQLSAGFNLLFTGFGSKRQLLQAFAQYVAEDLPLVHVHGYLPSVSMRYIIALLFAKIFKTKVPSRFRSLDEQCCEFVRLLSRHERSLCIVVHSIDGASLRSADIQKALSVLAASPWLHFVASIDHINARFLWGEAECKRFSWCENCVHTYAMYQDEVLVSGWMQARSNHDRTTASGVKFILKSLTPTDLSVLQCLAHLQLNRSSSSPTAALQHVSYSNWMNACRRQLLLTTSSAERNTAKCLEEHGLIVLRRHHSNKDEVWIPFGDHVIQQIILGPSPHETHTKAQSQDHQDLNSLQGSENDLL